jgi:hypothetical protein
MDVFTPNAKRRSTRLRVNIPVVVTSMDRLNPLVAPCAALVVSAQGAGIRIPLDLPVGTPVMLSDLPGGGSAAGRVASSRPLGTRGKEFLIGVALYNHGNVWGVENPPADWTCSTRNLPAASASSLPSALAGPQKAWPYNLATVEEALRKAK